MSAVAAPPERGSRPPEAPRERDPLVPAYVWEIPVRLTHWLIVLSMAVLVFTGLYIGRPFIAVTGGPSADGFLMGWMRYAHFLAAIVFTLSVASRILWMFVGNRYARWSQLIPATRTRWRGLVATLKFYLFARERPPEYVGHNPLAGATYTVVFVLYLVMIGTGFAMYSAGAHYSSPTRIFDFLIPVFGGLQTARWIHHVGMWLLIGFAVHHVYSAVLVDHLEKNATLGSIFSGNKWVRSGLMDRDDGYDPEEEGEGGRDDAHGD